MVQSVRTELVAARIIPVNVMVLSLVLMVLMALYVIVKKTIKVIQNIMI